MTELEGEALRARCVGFLGCEHNKAIALGSNPDCAIAALQESVSLPQEVFPVGAHTAIATEIAHEAIVGIIDSYHTVFASCPDIAIAILQDGANVVARKVKCAAVVAFDREWVLAE